MLRKVSRLLLVLALAGSLGLHWALLQSAAWVGMAVSFSQTAPLREALAKTFDGKHPCSLCKMVAEGKRSEKKQETLQPLVKLELFFVPSCITLLAPALDPLSFTPVEAMTARNEAPPTPPPRQLPG